MAAPVGTRRTTSQGYVRIKTRTGVRPWPFEHRVVWEEANGPIPAGHYIHHLNGLKADNRLENLVLVESNGQHHHLYHKGIPRPGVSRALKGRPHTPEHSARIASALRGKAKSESHRQHLREALLGRARPDISARLKGRTLAPEHRTRVVAAAIGRPRDPATGRFASIVTPT